jgi:GntR family transcriptional regulator
MRGIAVGSVGQNGWLPSKPVLASTYGVTVGTIQRALDMLVDQRLVEPVPGRGVMLRRDVVRRDSADVARQEGAWRGFPLSVLHAGAEPYSDSTIRDVLATAEIAQWLAVPVGTAVLERNRTQGQITDGTRQPIQIAITWFSPTISAQLPILREHTTGPGGMYSRLTEVGHVLRWEDTVSERPPIDDEPARLDLTPDQHVLLVWRRCYNQEDRIVEVTRRAIRADRSPIVYRYD